MPVYALMLGKPPLKLKESPPDPAASPRNDALVNVTVAVGAAGTSVDLGQGSSYTLGAGGKFDARRMTAEMIASTLERYCDRPAPTMLCSTSRLKTRKCSGSVRPSMPA
jgi:uncharacterized protein (TIGR03435 family)